MRNASCCCGLKLTEKTTAGQNAETMSWCSVGPNWNSPSQGSGTLRKRSKGWRVERYGLFWMRLAMAMNWLTASEAIYIHWPCQDFITGERCYNALFVLEILEVLWLHSCQFLRFIDVSTNEESKCILGYFWHQEGLLTSLRLSPGFLQIRPLDSRSLYWYQPQWRMKGRSREETRKFKELGAASVS